MTRGETYQALSRLFEYPREREELLQGLKRVAVYCGREGLEFKAAPYLAFVEGASLETLQEDFVATFDFDPARAPYLGHHLYGDPRQRAEFMIRLKGAFERAGFSPEGCELPDHLSVLLAFLSHLEGDPGGKGVSEAAEKILREGDERGELDKPNDPSDRNYPDDLDEPDDLEAWCRRLVAEEVLPGVRKLGWGEEKGNTHWLPLFATVESLLSADGKEVPA
ncbi:molecular chaperone TorD family protein [Geomonas sp. Red32]|uniref:nitrate reductase molybdenum cofactor assembly chaperone n=1 Tax=Geomonas sp. Red32 TaxID=2912856 RepID=UPI00202CCA41|nr:molecular chaperone TorD family protein [Geomonas sp. Red32]MCM0080690.1 molecular chaperone TorD family protein [Geomonas sp. Red32]